MSELAFYDALDETLDCNECGLVLRRLTEQEAIYAATHPGDAAFCHDCAQNLV